MTTARLSPGDLERLLETQSQVITSTLERLVPMLLPIVIRENYAACEACGAVTVDPAKHKEWHDELGEAVLRLARVLDYIDNTDNWDASFGTMVDHEEIRRIVTGET